MTNENSLRSIGQIKRTVHLRWRSRRTANRLGAAAVEFAMIVPLMLLLTFGLIEIGRFSMLRDVAVHATREGARIGIRPQATNNDVRQKVQEELDRMGVVDAAIEVQRIEGQGADMIQVDVRVPIANNSWVPNGFPHSISAIGGSTTMRCESSN